MTTGGADFFSTLYKLVIEKRAVQGDSSFFTCCTGPAIVVLAQFLSNAWPGKGRLDWNKGAQIYAVAAANWSNAFKPKKAFHCMAF